MRKKGVFPVAPTYFGVHGALSRVFPYGENPRQGASAFYHSDPNDLLGLGNFSLPDAVDLPEGYRPSECSYNGHLDLARAVTYVRHIAATYTGNFSTRPNIAVAVKHGNACGAAAAEEDGAAIQMAVDGDRRAIFGALVLTNFPINAAHARTLVSRGMPEGVQRPLDCVAAPGFSTEARELLLRRSGKCRLLSNRALSDWEQLRPKEGELDIRSVPGGYLVQERNSFVLDLSDEDVTMHGVLPNAKRRCLALAAAIGQCSNSNTITLVNHGMLIGNGVGQQDRVSCAELAVKRACDAGHDVADAVAYSDAFFPFRDGVDVLIKAGVCAIFAPSGSMRDHEVVAACKEAGVTLVQLPTSEARGFFHG